MGITPEITAQFTGKAVAPGSFRLLALAADFKILPQILFLREKITILKLYTGILHGKWIVLEDRLSRTILHPTVVLGVPSILVTGVLCVVSSKTGAIFSFIKGMPSMRCP